MKNDERFHAVLNSIDDLIANPDKYPDKFIPIPLKNSEITRIFTKKRIELIELIKGKQPVTVTKLAKITKRNVAGVIRDVRLLRELHVISAEKRGKEVILMMKQDFLVIPILPTLTLREIEKRKELAVARD